MEEKHFEQMDRKSDKTVTDKNATEDFLNSETGRCNNDTECPDQCSIKVFAPAEIKSITSIDSGLEHDIEKTDNNVNPSIEVPTIKEPDLSIDDNLPNTVTLLKTPDGDKCYLVGTAHFSIESQNDVSKVIQAVQPHIVMVELCPDRIHVLQLDEETILKEAKNLDFNTIVDTIKKNGVYKGLFYICLLNMSAHLTKVLGLAPGGEFRRAFKEVKKIPNCMVQMGDRPIKITFARALSGLTWWQTMKLSWQLLTEKEPMTQKDVEKMKVKDTLEEIMAELTKKYPSLGEVFVKERDIYLTHSLQMACKTVRMSEKPARVVGVVGMGHTIGIVENWGKVKPSQIPPILSIPPPSLSSKILKYTIKASIIGAVIYAGYKMIPLTTNIMQTMKSSVEGLIKVSVSPSEK